MAGYWTYGYGGVAQYHEGADPAPVSGGTDRGGSTVNPAPAPAPVKPAPVAQPSAGTTQADIAANQAFINRVLNYSVVDPSTRNPAANGGATGGKTMGEVNGWPAPTDADRAKVAQLQASNPDLYVHKEGLLSKIDTNLVQPAVKGIVVGGITAGLAGAAGIGPAAAPGPAGPAMGANAGIGTGAVTSSGAPVLGTMGAAAAAPVAGAVAPAAAGGNAVFGGGNMSAAATPTTGIMGGLASTAGSVLTNPATALLAGPLLTGGGQQQVVAQQPESPNDSEMPIQQNSLNGVSGVPLWSYSGEAVKPSSVQIPKAAEIPRAGIMGRRVVL